MRKLALAALATTLLTTPALARDKSWYIGVDAGPAIAQDQNFKIGAVPSDNAKADLGRAWDVDGNVGYDFGGFRLEAEVAYKRARLDAWQSQVTTAANAVLNGPLVNIAAGSFNYAGGQTSALSFMLNGLLDFGEDDGLQGFVGAGVGVARVKSDFALNTLGRSFLNDSSSGIAWQGLAGIRAPLSGNWDVGLKYRYFNAPTLNMIDANGRTNATRFTTHSILGGISYNFGGSPAPVPVAVPPTPPAPAVVEQAPPPPPPAPVDAPQPPKVCTPGPYIVFFDHNKADITAEAAGILDNAVAQYADCGNAQVMLAGHADRSGNPAYNVKLSERRNANVRAYLASHGINDGAISSQAYGEGSPKVQTADGVREIQNRRVEVTYGPGSGN